MYSNYSSYLDTIDLSDIRTSTFKHQPQYTGILEHVSESLGQEYLTLIRAEYSRISADSILEYVEKNDRYGGPQKYTYTMPESGVHFECSPTSLRYVYHALLILDHYAAKQNQSKSIVEVGCGYGGLCLAIDHFARVRGIAIDHYYLVDLPQAIRVIDKYLSAHPVAIPWSTHLAYQYGEDIVEHDLFFISNYCLTEIEPEHHAAYRDLLIKPKTKHGFITWQTGMGCPISRTLAMDKFVYYAEERPQTAPAHISKNYFVYF
jgi:putative sugar O-methyltransferase